MSLLYTPRPLPDVRDSQEFAKFFHEELTSLSASLGLKYEGQTLVAYNEPNRPKHGQMQYADGVKWNPGGGQGYYYFDSTLAWKELLHSELSTTTALTHNLYWDGGWKYEAVGAGSALNIGAGILEWYSAPSAGGAGTSATLTRRMYVDSTTMLLGGISLRLENNRAIELANLTGTYSSTLYKFSDNVIYLDNPDNPVAIRAGIGGVLSSTQFVVLTTGAQVYGSAVSFYLSDTNGVLQHWRLLAKTGTTSMFRIYDHTLTADRLAINASGRVQIGGLTFPSDTTVYLSTIGGLQLGSSGGINIQAGGIVYVWTGSLGSESYSESCRFAAPYTINFASDRYGIGLETVGGHDATVMLYANSAYAGGAVALGHYDGATFTARVFVNNAGEVLINSTTDQGTYNFQVTGDSIFNSEASSEVTLTLVTSANFLLYLTDTNGTDNTWGFAAKTGTTAQFRIYNVTLGQEGLSMDSTGHLLMLAGTNGSPIYSFLVDPDTGMYNSNTNELSFSTGGTKRLVITSNGYLYGTALHFAGYAGSGLEGPTNQYVASGTYTPTLTNGANVTSSTAYTCQWLRVGNVVTVSGRVGIDPNIATTVTQLGMSLPIASNLVNVEECAGSGWDPAFSQGIAVYGDGANNRAQFDAVLISSNAQTFYFSFTYLIL